MENKQACYSCKQHKPHSDFYPSSIKWKQHKCISCCKLYPAYKHKVSKHYKPFEQDGKLYKTCRACKNNFLLQDFYKISPGLCNGCGWKRNYESNRRYRNNHLHVKLKENIRIRILELLRKKNIRKQHKITELLGCSVKDLIIHLESKFQPGMTWDNHGVFGWHMDHIKPCASFDLTKIEDQKQCFHYTNLQPLWWQDNLAKSDKIL